MVYTIFVTFHLGIEIYESSGPDNKRLIKDLVIDSILKNPTQLKPSFWLNLNGYCLQVDSTPRNTISNDCFRMYMVMLVYFLSILWPDQS